jgi:acyl-coenzyme A synthetase/AMP-(fatty) acid ligase
LPYKYPRYIRFVDELPKTGTGKIDRQALLRM